MAQEAQNMLNNHTKKQLMFKDANAYFQEATKVRELFLQQQKNTKMKFSIALSLISPIFWPSSKFEIYAYSRPKTQNFLLFH